MPGLGKNVKKGGNPSTELYDLLILNRILSALTLSPGGLASESTLISVLNAITVANQDIEILLVRDKGNGDLVVKQVTDYSSGVPTIYYKDVDGNDYTPVGPLEYLDPSMVMNLILSELTNLNGLVATEATLSALDAKVTAVDTSVLAIESGGNLEDIRNEIVPDTRTLTNEISTGVGTIPAGSICGSVFNSGGVTGVWNGIAFPAGTSISWPNVGNRDTYNQIPFDATGTTFIISYTT